MIQALKLASCHDKTFSYRMVHGEMNVSLLQSSIMILLEIVHGLLHFCIVLLVVFI